jgi:hypothetical protein
MGLAVRRGSGRRRGSGPEAFGATRAPSLRGQKEAMDGVKVPGDPAPKHSARRPRRGASRPRGEAASDWLPECHLPLVEEDRLAFRILPAVPGRPPPPGLAEKFRDAYAAAWRRVPAEARDLLLAYWAGRGLPWPGDDPRSPPPSPLVQVRESSPPPHAPDVTRFGRQLAFPAALARDPGRFRDAVALALAHVYRMANRRHFRMALELLEDPMQAWESGLGAGATEEETDAMWALLQARFLLEQKVAVGALLDSWGFGGDTLADGGERGSEKV